MSQMGQYLPLNVVSTLTGNVGGAIAPTAGNINILGAGFLTVTGTLATSTLTISDDGTVATSYVTDAGTANPALNILNVLGGTNINTVGAANNLTVNLDDNITVTSMSTAGPTDSLFIQDSSIVATGTSADVYITLTPKGAGTVTVNNLGFFAGTVQSATDLTLSVLNPGDDIIVSTGTPYAPIYFGAANELTALGPLANGQLMIGSTGAAPTAASLTSADNTIGFTAGAGSLDLVVGNTVATTFTSDAGAAVPVANNLNIVGGAGIATAGAGDTLTISGTGASTYAYTAVNASPYVVLATDNVISVDCAGGVIEIQLPNAATVGQAFRIKDRNGAASANNITITTVGGVVTIDGAATFVMNVDYESVTVVGNGSSYEVL